MKSLRMKKYKYAHVTKTEEERFQEYTFMERKIMYARAVLRHHQEYTYWKLYKVLRWKFGSGIGKSLYKEIVENM